MLTANAAGLKHRKNSLISNLTTLGVGVFTLQETHFQKKGKFQLKDWHIFEAIRKKNYGGTMIGIHESLNPILITEYNNPFELLVTEMTVGKKGNKADFWLWPPGLLEVRGQAALLLSLRGRNFKI